LRDLRPEPRLGGALLTLALAAITLPLLAQQRFGETTSTVVVEVPVQVLRDGQPVRGLTRDDFEIYDGRRKQQITGFEVVDLQPAAAPATAAAAKAPTTRAARRHFLVLFDLAISDPKAVVKARDAAMEMVQALHPTDLVAVAAYLPSAGPQLLLGFTADRNLVENAA
jgi:VWFA-related protein